MKTAVIYARYSSYGQTEQSIEGQVRECTDYAKANDILIVGSYIDRAMTGTNDNRTDFQRMIKDSAKGAWDLVLVYKLDRFSRNKYEMAIHRKTLKDNGVKVVSVKENIPDSPEGIILESLLEGMADQTRPIRTINLYGKVLFFCLKFVQYKQNKTQMIKYEAKSSIRDLKVFNL